MDGQQILQHRNDPLLDVSRTRVRQFHDDAPIAKAKPNIPFNHNPRGQSLASRDLFTLAFEFPRPAPAPPARRPEQKPRETRREVHRVDPDTFVVQSVPVNPTNADKLVAQRQRALAHEWNMQRMGREPYKNERSDFTCNQAGS